MGLIKKMDGYEIWESDKHGKACKGAKKTNGIQVRQPSFQGYLLKKNFQYKISEQDGRAKAIKRAEKFVTENPIPF